MRVQLLKLIPPTLWGIFFGSLISIVTVLITNSASDKRMKAQFENERETKTREREMTLRKEVYLNAAEAVAAGMNAISRFANLDLPNDQITNDYVIKSPAISKVHVIGNAEVVQAIVTFTSELGVTFLALFAKRYELMIEKNQITILDQQIVQLGKSRDSILEMIKQYNIEGIDNQRRWKVLQDNFEFEQNRVQEYSDNRKALFDKLYPKQLDLMRECVKHTTTLSKTLIPVLLTVRDELELPLDEASYRQVMQIGIANQELAINQFVDKFMPNPSQGLVK